jgi:hypothetical protein
LTEQGQLLALRQEPMWAVPEQVWAQAAKRIQGRRPDLQLSLATGIYEQLSSTFFSMQ